MIFKRRWKCVLVNFAITHQKWRSLFYSYCPRIIETFLPKSEETPDTSHQSLVARVWVTLTHKPSLWLWGFDRWSDRKVISLVAGLLVRSQYPEGPATGHLGTGFSWFPCVYKRMLRWFPRLQVATACFSCSPPDLNFLDPYSIFMLPLFHIYVRA